MHWGMSNSDMDIIYVGRVGGDDTDVCSRDRGWKWVEILHHA